MLEWLAHWMTRFMWREIDDPSAFRDAPVLLTWKGATGSARHRLGVYRDARTFEGEDCGSGFVCWWSGRPLTDAMTHWAPPPLTPNTKITGPQGSVHRQAGR